MRANGGSNVAHATEPQYSSSVTYLSCQLLTRTCARHRRADVNTRIVHMRLLVAPEAA